MKRFMNAAMAEPSRSGSSVGRLPDSGRRSLLHRQGRWATRSRYYAAVLRQDPRASRRLASPGPRQHPAGPRNRGVALDRRRVERAAEFRRCVVELWPRARRARSVTRRLSKASTRRSRSIVITPCAQQSRIDPGGARPHGGSVGRAGTGRWPSIPTMSRRCTAAATPCTISSATRRRWSTTSGFWPSGLTISTFSTIVAARWPSSAVFQRRSKATTARSRSIRRDPSF